MLKFGGNFRLKSHCKSNRSECSFSESVLTDRRRSVAALSEQIDRRICQFRIHFDRFGRRFLFTRDRETRDRQPDRMNTRLAGRRRIAKSSGPLLVCWPTANHDRQSSLSPFAAAVAVSSFTKCQPVSWRTNSFKDLSHSVDTARVIMWQEAHQFEEISETQSAQFENRGRHAAGNPFKVPSAQLIGYVLAQFTRQTYE